MNKKILTLVVAMVVGWQSCSFAAATQVDALIQKLVDKGILDKAEARELKMEIAEDAKILQEDAAKSVVPDWVKNTKVKGDVRVRYQYERRSDDTDARTRGRLRFRLGIENIPAPQWKVGAGLASSESGSSGTDDARSTNMTFNDSFRRGDIRLDYAYVEHQPADWAKVIAGKYVKTDYLWTTSDMMWDTDINPAGASVHLEHKVVDPLTVFTNTGAWVIDENNKADLSDPYVFYGQSGLKYKEGMFDATAAAIYYGFNGVTGVALDGVSQSSGTATTNTVISGTTLKYDYDAAGAALELGVKKPVAALPIERLAFFGDYIQNVSKAVKDDETGWAAGVKIGDEKVAGPKQWQLKYQYTYLGKDAVIDVLPDSDRIGGGTDLKGHEWELQYGITKNVSIGLDYYQDQRIKATKNPQKLIQADVNVKF